MFALSEFGCNEAVEPAIPTHREPAPKESALESVTPVARHYEMTNANRTSTILPAMAAITCLSVIVAHGNLYAANEDLRPDISEEEYSRGLNRRQADVRQSEEDAKAARAALNQTLARLADTEAQFENAIVLFAEAEKNLNDPEKLREAWGAVIDAHAAQEELTQTRDRQRDELQEAEQAVQMTGFG